MSTLVSPKRLLDLRFGYISARSIGAAVELGIFEALTDKSQSISDLATRLGSSERGIRILSQALVSLGLLGVQGNNLSLTDESRTFLVSASPRYLGGLIVATDRHWNKWGRLAEAVSTGSAPHHGIESDADDGHFFSQFVQGLFNLNLPAAEEVAAVLAQGGQLVADLGCGSAVWSIPWARRGARVIGVDRQCILDDVTKKYLLDRRVADRYELRAGNLRNVELEEAAFDAILLGHVLHSEGRERSLTLLQRCRKALKPGGKVIIAEMIPDDERVTDSYGIFFGVNMLMLTEEGEVFTAEELQAMLRETGFSRWSWLEVPFPYPVLIGHR